MLKGTSSCMVLWVEQLFRLHSIEQTFTDSNDQLDTLHTYSYLYLDNYIGVF